MQVINYNDPFVLTKAVSEFENLDRQNTRFLDFGCGTGILGRELAKFGFSQFDGIDATDKFVELAKSQSAYLNTHKMWLGLNDGSFPQHFHSQYDVIMSTGCFMEGHFPRYVLDDMWMAGKNGALILFGCRDTDFDEDPKKLGYAEKCAQLVHEAKIESVQRIKFNKNPAANDKDSGNNPYFMDQKGSIHIYRVKK